MQSVVNTVQVRAADSDEALRQVFVDSDFEALIGETGFRRPLSLLTLQDVEGVEATLKSHLLLKVKPELDQLMEGLDLCGVLESINECPALMATYFIYSPQSLTKGTSQLWLSCLSIYESGTLFFCQRDSSLCSR